MTTDRVPLLPCPFCGSAKIGFHSERDFDECGTYHAIQCKDCGARSRQHYVSDGNDCPLHRQEVRDDWNKRAAVTVDVPAKRDELGGWRCDHCQEWNRWGPNDGNCTRCSVTRRG